MKSRSDWYSLDWSGAELCEVNAVPLAFFTFNFIIFAKVNAVNTGGGTVFTHSVRRSFLPSVYMMTHHHHHMSYTSRHRD